MSTFVKVARYHLVQPFPLLVVTWLILAFTFVVSCIAFALTPVGHPALTGHAPAPAADTRVTGALCSFFLFFFVLGVQSVGRSLPFGMALGISRRAYFTGTALLAAVVAAADGLGLAALQAAERATDGWGVQMSFFRVPYLLNGPWYLTWLTSFVGLTLLFVYGMWFGTVFRRWGVLGTVAFAAVQVTAVLGVALLISAAHGWPEVGRLFTGLTALGLTGLLAALAVALLMGGQATIRRTAV
jgi:hypothetical protein